ncbi:tryptophan dimethylallyltransferase family protein [Crossiella sp. CA198]|uniref:tryptophan dimethylallyltransferase family protein n=1 Tax=Crossiella sp. CA198 TaxID=3455607 RepID=UPI003F8D47C7
MGMAALSLADDISARTNELCRAVGLSEFTNEYADLVREMLGPGGNRPLGQPPAWPSDVADDHTPVEFSLAVDHAGRPAVRLLLETQGDRASVRANVCAARALLPRLAERYGFSLAPFEAVADLFLPADPRGSFAWWWSIVLRPAAPPAFKIYFNPEVRGRQAAAGLVAAGLDRLGFGGAFGTLKRRALRPCGDLDRYSFFSIDLHTQPDPRVKVYLSHHDGDLTQLLRAAGAAREVDEEQVREFTAIAGGNQGRFTGRPLISSLSFLAGDTDRASGFSVYLPVRDYVEDDAVALDRAHALLARHGLDPALLDRALSALARRPLNEGVGLIPHLSLRTGRPHAGLTVYLSAETYAVTPPRPESLAS